ncbi:hypothetical protein FRC04_003989 [Tulasnella sp. 424]|nr:hypothetical protein FRC04_003989 [Tulasnella sp. 424]
MISICDTVWPRRSTDTAQGLKQTIENAQSLNNIPNDENHIRREYRASLRQFVRIMEGIRGRLSEASNKYGAKERGFGSHIKYLSNYLDRDRCTEILESCHNEIGNALGFLPDRWNLEEEEGKLIFLPTSDIHH